MKRLSVLLGLLMLLVLAGCDPDALSGDSGTFTDSRDGQSYQWVKIGEVRWMAENLAWLPAVSKPVTLSSTEKLYYVLGYDGTVTASAKATANYTNYGVLYNWPAAVAACPQGWRLPTDAEWTALTDGYGGLTAAGKSLKSTTDWNANNGDNRSGFNALPAGALDHQYGFGGLKYIGAWWSATTAGSTTAWYRSVNSVGNSVNRNSPSQQDGYSVRCIKE